MIIGGVEVLSTREIVDRLASSERSKRSPDLSYLQALEDVIFYDEQHRVRRKVIAPSETASNDNGCHNP